LGAGTVEAVVRGADDCRVEGNRRTAPTEEIIMTTTSTSDERLEFIGADSADLSGTATASLAARAGRVPPVEWHGNRKNCIVNVTAKAALAWVRNPGEPMHLALLLTVNGDIHNPHVFVGIDVPFSVEVMVDGVQSQTMSFNLFAPAVLDPRGSDQWYTFKREADELDQADLADLNRITLQITI
jgi:hypothetical protein